MVLAPKVSAVTDAQIKHAADLWNQGFDTHRIAKAFGRHLIDELQPYVWNARGCSWPPVEAIVYNHLPMIRKAARERRHARHA
jgi:hypothetical protein